MSVKQKLLSDVTHIRQFQKSEKTMEDMVAAGWKQMGSVFIPWLSKRHDLDTRDIPGTWNVPTIAVELQVKGNLKNPAKGVAGYVVVGKYEELAATVGIDGHIHAEFKTGIPEVTAIATLLDDLPAPGETKGLAYPNKRTSMQVAPKWTTDSYKAVCDYMRGTTASSSMRLKQLMTALDAYMKHSALVVPTVPRALSFVSPVVLWRGVQLSPIMQAVPKVGQTMTSNAGCYTAFSIDRRIAQTFASGGHSRGGVEGFLFRLRSDRIARGTPWIWFMENETHGLPPRWKNALSSTFNKEKEVLLPPGYFKVLAVSNAAKLPIVDIAFVPRPRYVRRGAVPKLNGQGRAVTKTTAGHRLVLNHAQLSDNTRKRRESIASRAAASLRRAKK